MDQINLLDEILILLWMPKILCLKRLNRAELGNILILLELDILASLQHETKVLVLTSIIFLTIIWHYKIILVVTHVQFYWEKYIISKFYSSQTN